MKNKYINISIIILIILIILLLLVYYFYFNNIPNEPKNINTEILDFVSNTYTVDDIKTPKWDKK